MSIGVSDLGAEVVHVVSLRAGAHPRASSPVDLSCNISEVARLLWTMIVLSGAVGVFTVWRPSWRLVAGVVVAALTWLWIDMEGPVLLARGSHGIHLADVPVLVALPALAVAAVRLLWRRRL